MSHEKITKLLLLKLLDVLKFFHKAEKITIMIGSRNHISKSYDDHQYLITGDKDSLEEQRDDVEEEIERLEEQVSYSAFRDIC